MKLVWPRGRHCIEHFLKGNARYRGPLELEYAALALKLFSEMPAMPPRSNPAPAAKVMPATQGRMKGPAAGCRGFPVPRVLAD